MADIFRKKSLEKLVSTEQLDRMITIIKPSFWIVFFAAAIIVVAGLVWGIFGRLPLCIDGIGIVHQEGHQTEQTLQKNYFCWQRENQLIFTERELSVSHIELLIWFLQRCCT